MLFFNSVGPGAAFLDYMYSENSVWSKASLIDFLEPILFIYINIPFFSGGMEPGL
jgi:hypothetical protein